MSVSLDSFLDILTCLEGVLMLIIISTGIDAAQTKVLIPTPMEQESEKKPIYIECRNDQMFEIPVDDLIKKSQDKLEEIAKEAKGDSLILLQKMGESTITNEAFEVDLTYALLGQIAILPIADASGYPLTDYSKENEMGWYGKIVTSLNHEKEMISFIVRDDSFNVFKQARRYAWGKRADVSYDLIGVDEPIRFGVGGSRLKTQ